MSGELVGPIQGGGESRPVPVTKIQDETTWTAAWGDQAKVGDLMKVKVPGTASGSLSGRVLNIRQFDEYDARGIGHPVLGFIFELTNGQQAHMKIAPSDPVFVAVEVPRYAPVEDGGSEGTSE